MTTFTWVPDAPLTKKVKASVNRSPFGDGYSQRSADGINSIRGDLLLKFTVRTRTEINAIEAFLESTLGSASFNYTPPGLSARKYTCDSWDATYYNDSNAELSCEFKQVFEV